jgi:SAM-dependent methyltransferase
VVLEEGGAVSETRAARSSLVKYCVGRGLDIGYGGDCISENAWSFDMPVPYTHVGNDRQMLRGDCRQLGFVCDGALDFIYSSHLIEDFHYGDQITLIREWRRCLAPNGVLIINCPNQQRFLAHCAKTGQSINDAHKEPDYSLKNFVDRVLVFSGEWEIIHQDPQVGAYSWYLVARKT